MDWNRAGSVITSGTTDPDKGGWYEVDMGNINVPADFVISMHLIHGYAPCLFVDTDSSADRSWEYPWSSEGYPWSHETEVNYMIRAIVCTNVTPDINVTLEMIDVELQPDDSVDVPLTICNEGDSDLEYNISISYDTDGKAIEGSVGAIAGISLMRGTAVTESVEIGYDDGDADDTIYFASAGSGMAVHFTSPDRDTLETARFYLYLNNSAPDNSFDWSVLEWGGTVPGRKIASGTTTPTKTDDWYDVDMGGITVPEDFVIAMYWKQGYAPYIGYDDDSPIDNRSLLYSSGFWISRHGFLIKMY